MRLIALAVLAAVCAALPAATFTVTTLADTGTGSLRDAITQAEANAGADNIVFAASLNLPGTITLQTALPDITENLTITGPASDDLIVQRNTAAAAFRIFTIAAGTVEISHLWLGNGAVTSTAPGAAEGGCIHNAGTLILSNCLIFDCSATGGNASTGDGGPAFGGAIFATGPVTLSETAILDCAATGGDTADGTGFAGVCAGGGINAGATLTMLRCSASGCTAQAGTNTGLASQVSAARGGALALAASTVLRDCDIANCAALNAAGTDDAGSGIYLPGGAALDMARSSVRGGTGTGLHLNGDSTLVNCTVSGNVGDETGGIRVLIGAVVTIEYCTVTLNSGTTTGGVRNSAATIDMLGSIVAQNTGSSPDASGAFNDSGFNLIGDATGSTGFNTSTLVGNSLNPINPDLGAIQDFGDTWGHIPLFGSFAIDQGGGAAPIDDQRGANRLFGAPPDIGAVEFIPNQAPSFTAGPTVTVENDGDEVTFPGWATNINPGVSWEAGQALTFTVTGNFFSFREPPEIDADTGDLTFRPWEGDEGVFVFNVVLHDNGGTAGGGQDTSSTSILVIELENDDDDDDEHFEDEDFDCSTGNANNQAWLGLLWLLGLLACRLRRT